MEIGRFRHKGLRRLYEDDDGSQLPAPAAKKIKRILAALAAADDLSQVETIPGWRLHPLKEIKRILAEGAPANQQRAVRR